MSAIKVTGLSKSFSENLAVDNISFDVPYGQITALLGSNGAGKSTTLNMIAGIMIPSNGEIEIAGLNYKDHYKDIKRKLGYLTCDMALYPTFSLYENFKLLADLRGLTKSHQKDRIEILASQFSLEEMMDKRFDELSSGQKQRALVASSIFHDPDILIFDEVTASLDVIISKDIMDFLIAEKKRGKAVLFSTHILSEVEYISDRILFIERGELVSETSCEQLMRETNAANITEAFYGQLQKNKAA